MFSIRLALKYLFLGLGFFTFIQASYASSPLEQRAVIISPFEFSDGAAPDNILEEMNIDIDLPRIIFNFFKEHTAYKDISLVDSDSNVNADVVIKAQIQHVSGGNGAARYFGGLGGAGRSALVVNVKVFDRDDNLVHEAIVNQNGAKGGSIVTVWSNKNNITSAMNEIARKVYVAALAGDVTTPQGVIRALGSNNPLAIQLSARLSHNLKLFEDKSVTDAMEQVLLRTLDGQVDNKYFIDGAAWCAINIGASLDKKYTATLDKVTSSKAHRKIKKHAKKGLKGFRKNIGK